MGLIFKEKHNKNSYQIFLQDVDGLIVGSPVRMMGVEVGHVAKIKPLKDNVYVKFILTNPDVYIPQGTAVTVEFTGLAGSKSLEIYLPNKDNYIDKTVPLLQVESPKRLHDAFGLLNDMFDKLGSIIHTTSSFGTKIQSEKFLPSKKLYQKDNIKNFLKFSNKFLDDSNEKATEIKNNLMRLDKNAK